MRRILSRFLCPLLCLCLLAGLTNMRADVFTVILLAGKPLTIAVYSAIYLYAGSLLAFAG